MKIKVARATIPARLFQRVANMALAGQGAITIWQDVRPEARADFFEWHNREHIPERVSIPGFLRGRRWAAIEGAPEMFTLYETAGPEVHTGADYLARLNDPTPLTKRVAPNMVNNVRSLCRVVFSTGNGRGGMVATYRYDVVAGKEEAQLALLTGQILPMLAKRPGIAGVHLCLADSAASSVQPEEKKSRPQQARVPTWVILVEGNAGREILDGACREMLRDDVLQATGAVTIERGIYQLQFEWTHAEQ
ncbi:MAG: hypothetical protein ABI790_16380 [Betaproteobacteria bacterium]